MSSMVAADRLGSSPVGTNLPRWRGEVQSMLGGERPPSGWMVFQPISTAESPSRGRFIPIGAGRRDAPLVRFARLPVGRVARPGLEVGGGPDVYRK